MTFFCRVFIVFFLGNCFLPLFSAESLEFLLEDERSCEEVFGLSKQDLLPGVHVISGGPGAGKTTLLHVLAHWGCPIKDLHFSGEEGNEFYCSSDRHSGFSTIPESATVTIRKMQKLGFSEPWNEFDFQFQIMLLQAELDRRIGDAFLYEPIFSDRSCVDCQGYCRMKLKRGDNEALCKGSAITYFICKDYIEELDERFYSKNVLLLQPLPFDARNQARPENREEALHIADTLRKEYALSHFNVIELPESTKMCKMGDKESILHFCFNAVRLFQEREIPDVSDIDPLFVSRL